MFRRNDVVNKLSYHGLSNKKDKSNERAGAIDEANASRKFDSSLRSCVATKFDRDFARCDRRLKYPFVHPYIVDSSLR